MYSHKNLDELTKLLMEKRAKTIVDAKEIFQKGKK